ncbi:hypothetical protein GGR74_001262 [Xanthomonas arboricola]
MFYVQALGMGFADADDPVVCGRLVPRSAVHGHWLDPGAPVHAGLQVRHGLTIR